MQVKRQQLELDMEQWPGSKLGKEYVKAVYCHAAYLTYMQSTSCEMLDWWGTSWNQDYQEKYKQPQKFRWYHPIGRKQRGTKEPLDKMKEESEKADLKFNIQKRKSGPIISWQIDGEHVETVSDFIFLGSKINADGDSSHEIKRHVLLRKIAMTNLDSVLKSRHIPLLTKVRIVKPMFFAVVI